MAGLGSLELELSANVARLQSDLGKAGSIVADFSRGVKTALATLGVGIGVGVFTAMIKETIDYADRLNDLRTRTGATGQELITLEGAAVRSGVSFEAVSDVTSKLSKRLGAAALGSGEASRAFEAMGIEVKNADGSLKGINVILREVGEKFKGYEDGANKSVIATAALGRGGDKLIPMLENITDTEQRFKRLGITIDEDVITAADRYKDTMDDLDSLHRKFSMQLVQFLLPYLQQFAEYLIDVKKEGAGVKFLIEGITTVMEALIIVGSEVSFTFTTIGKDIARAIENVKLIAKGDFAGSRALGELFKQDAIEARKALDAYQNRLLGRFPADKKDNFDMQGKVPRKVAPTMADPKDLAKIAAEQKQYEHALQRLELQINAINGKSEEQNTWYELVHGSLKTLTIDHGVEVVALARKYDALKNEIAAREYLVKEYAEQGARQDALTDAVNNYKIAIRTAATEQQFQLDLIGKTTYEQGKLNGLRAMELDFRARGAALPEGEGQAAALEALAIEAQKARDAFVSMYDDIYIKSRAASTGMTEAINEYADAASNAAMQTKNLFTNAFKSIEDAIVNFVMTGKLDFKSLADSIIKDLVRIQVQRLIMGPLVGTAQSPGVLSQGLNSISGGIGSFIGGLFKAGGGPVSGGNSYIVGEQGPELFTPGVSGSITPNSAMGGGVSIYNTYHIDSRSDGGAIQAAIERGSRRTQQQIIDSMKRGGAFAAATGITR